jgi:hypothetical protein
MSIYKVTIAEPLSFPAEQRIRAGIKVLKDTGYEGELSDVQLKAIKADNYLALEEVAPATPPAPTKKEILAAAEEEGLELTVTERDTVAVIKAAIEEARNAQATPPAPTE